MQWIFAVCERILLEGSLTHHTLEICTPVLKAPTLKELSEAFHNAWVMSSQKKTLENGKSIADRNFDSLIVNVQVPNSKTYDESENKISEFIND